MLQICPFRILRCRKGNIIGVSDSSEWHAGKTLNVWQNGHSQSFQWQNSCCGQGSRFILYTLHVKPPPPTWLTAKERYVEKVKTRGGNICSTMTSQSVLGLMQDLKLAKVLRWLKSVTVCRSGAKWIMFSVTERMRGGGGVFSVVDLLETNSICLFIRTGLRYGLSISSPDLHCKLLLWGVLNQDFISWTNLYVRHRARVRSFVNTASQPWTMTSGPAWTSTPWWTRGWLLHILSSPLRFMDSVSLNMPLPSLKTKRQRKCQSKWPKFK